MAPLVPDIFCYHYLVKNDYVDNSSTTTEGKERIRIDLEYFILEYFFLLYVSLSLKTVKFYLINLASQKVG